MSGPLIVKDVVPVIESDVFAYFDASTPEGQKTLSQRQPVVAVEFSSTVKKYTIYKDYFIIHMSSPSRKRSITSTPGTDERKPKAARTWAGDVSGKGEEVSFEDEFELDTFFPSGKNLLAYVNMRDRERSRIISHLEEKYNIEYEGGEIPNAQAYGEVTLFDSVYDGIAFPGMGKEGIKLKKKEFINVLKWLNGSEDARYKIKAEAVQTDEGGGVSSAPEPSVDYHEARGEKLRESRRKVKGYWQRNARRRAAEASKTDGKPATENVHNIHLKF